MFREAMEAAISTPESNESKRNAFSSSRFSGLGASIGLDINKLSSSIGTGVESGGSKFWGAMQSMGASPIRKDGK